MTQTSNFDPQLLAPLFRQDYSLAEAGKALTHEGVASWLNKMTLRLWHKSRVLRGAYDEDSLCVEAIGLLWQKVTRAAGLEAGAEGAPKDLAAFVARVLRNEIINIQRKLTTAKRGGTTTHSYLDADDEPEPRSETFPDAQRRLIVKGELIRVLKIARDPATGLSPLRRAAFIVHAFPEELSLAEADAARGQGGAGFARTAEETLRLVETHFVAMSVMPIEDSANQKTIAWITRCVEGSVSSWQAWEERDGPSARKALETVQKWYQRALFDIRKTVGGDL